MNKAEFTAYLESKDLATATIASYIECVEYGLKYLKTEEIQITKPDILNFLEHLKNKGLQNTTRQNYINALNHYFTFLFSKGEVLKNPCWGLLIRGAKKQILYKTYTPEELDQLCENYYHVFVRNFDCPNITASKRKQAILCRERNAVILSFLVNQGITAKEISRIEVADINLNKATVKVSGGKIGKLRNIPLKATQIGLIINYLQNIRPQILEYHTNESDKLFLTLPNVNKTETEQETMKHTIYSFTKQLKSMDKQFSSFKQLRASVITSWLQLYGLRKTQYLAGHRRIISTERYKLNNLDNLTHNINNLHPF
jgi:site-specific recombinase XerD